MFIRRNFRFHYKLMIALLLLAGTALITGCRQADPVDYFQLSDRHKSRVDAHLMWTSTYGTGTDRLRLPGFYAPQGGFNVYRVRHDADIYVFYGTGYGLFGEVYRVEQFDLQGNRVATGEFHCGETDAPVTLVRITTDDPNLPPLLGVGTYGMFQPVQDSQIGSETPLRLADIDMSGRAYLTLDYPSSDESLKAFGLSGHVRLSVKLLQFDGQPPPPNISTFRQKDGVFVESLDMDIPFLRLDTDEDGNDLPPYTPDRP